MSLKAINHLQVARNLIADSNKAESAGDLEKAAKMRAAANRHYKMV
jgi:hypothetical protein